MNANMRLPAIIRVDGAHALAGNWLAVAIALSCWYAESHESLRPEQSAVGARAVGDRSLDFYLAGYNSSRWRSAALGQESAAHRPCSSPANRAAQ